MMRRRLLFLFAAVAALFLLALLALPFLIDANRFRPMVEARLTRALGREVHVGSLDLHLFSGTVAASDVSIADDPGFSRAPFLTAKGLSFSIDLGQFIFSRKLNVTGIAVDSPEIALAQSPAGRWNFSSIGGSSAGPQRSQEPAAPSQDLDLSVQSAKITNARITLTQSGHPLTLDKVNLELRNFAPGAVSPFTFSAAFPGGGAVTLEGEAGPLDSADTAATPFHASVRITGLDLHASGLLPADSALAGIVAVDGSIEAKAQRVSINGKLAAERLKLVAGGAPAGSPLHLDVALTQDLAHHSGTLGRGDVLLGTVKATLTGNWIEPGKEPVIHAKFDMPGAPVAGIVDLLPALAITLPSGTSLEGGTAKAAFDMRGPASALVIAGPLSVANTRLKGFNLASKMAAIQQVAGMKSSPDMDIESLSGNIRITPEGTALDNLRLAVPALGELAGAGTVSPSQALDFKMHATVHPGAVASPLALPNIAFFVGGTASNPQFRPDVASMAQEELNRRLKGKNIGGVDGGGLLQGLFGGKKK
jgi:AsmA protein